MQSIIIFILILSLIGSAWSQFLQIKDIRERDEKIIDLESNYDKLLSQKKSSEVRLGQISENLAPFLKEFKYDPKKCHFLGNPIDYVIFEEDKIVFLEIKSGESALSSTQRNIRDLIKDGKVYFDQMRIK